MRPLVSVVIPTYNHAHFLGRALQSVVVQTYTNWEIVVVDNYSQDNTDEVINQFKDPRIKHLKIHNNGVIAASRNRGICEANGEWLAFLDSDDCWYREKLDIMLRVEAADSYDVVCHDELMVNIKTGAKRILRYGPYQRHFYRALLVEGNKLSPSATIVRRDALVRNSLAFNESRDYITAEDYDFWLNLARMGARFRFIHEVQGEYVLHETNSSEMHSRHRENIWNVLHDHVFKLQQFHPHPEILWKRVLCRLRLWQARELVANGQPQSALRLILEAAINSPSGTSLCIFSRLKSTMQNFAYNQAHFLKQGFLPKLKRTE